MHTSIQKAAQKPRQQSGRLNPKVNFGGRMITANYTSSKGESVPKTMELQHPLHDIPAIADVLGDWLENGRAVGLELQYPDGHHTFLTFQEIQELQAS